VVTLDRPEVRNAIDAATASGLATAFRAFDADEELLIAVLTGAGGTFCSGYDLKAFARLDEQAVTLSPEGDAPLGISRLTLSKPVIAAVEGYAVAGGLEIALWCDLRVAADNAVLGVFNRRWGIPLIDGGTIRLPRLVGQSRALDMILTGRPVGAAEALAIGLADRVVPAGTALAAALELATEIAKHPQLCMRSDRASLYEQWSLPTDSALRNEFAHGMRTIESGESQSGAARFAAGEGRHGDEAPRD